MFITKKKYEEALRKVEKEVAEKWEHKLAEYDRNYWREQETNRQREDIARRFDELSRRIHELEKSHGLVEETPVCPYAPKTCY